MRELVYLSTAKLNALAPRPGQSVFTGDGEIEVSLWGLRFKTVTAAPETALPWRRLGKAERQLSKQTRDFHGEPVPPPGTWISFHTALSAELPASWLDGLDVALFAGEHVDESGAVTALLLCGSGRHLTHRAGGEPAGFDGGGGSVPSYEWFRPPGELPDEAMGWRELDRQRREAAPDATVDEAVDAALAEQPPAGSGATGSTPAEAPGSGPAMPESGATGDPEPGAVGLWTGYALHRAVRQRAINPPVPMRGYARVLMSGAIRQPDGPRDIRIVLATPLAVEYSVSG